eukprot:COSAG06_NODE_24814_length_652_cov_0.509946_2_plen_47_part_01
MPWLYYTVKIEYLPRQARDKHREEEGETRTVCSAGIGMCPFRKLDDG